MAVLNTGLATPSTGFTIDQSLRFEDSSTTYLSRTPSASTYKIGTYSFWVKRGELGTINVIAQAGRDGLGNDQAQISFWSDDTLRIYSYRSSAYELNLITDALYRDTSAWYHIVVAWDTTQGTPANRCKVYVNGEQITDFSTETYPDADDLMMFENPNASNSGQCLIGAYWNTAADTSHSLSGYLSEFYFVDGTQLTQSSFGETGTYGEWKPIKYTGSYGTNGFYLSFAGGGVMSATGGDSTDTDGDYKAASFTQDGTFTPSATGYVEYLVIAGGGGGAANGGGGGAGGYRTGYLAVTEQEYSITVGTGGAAGTTTAGGVNGDDSVFSSITSLGGGGGGTDLDDSANDGGSGGGEGREEGPAPGEGTAGQGYDGGNGGSYNMGGGGGAGAVGGDAEAGAGTTRTGGVGGAGLASSITGSSVTRAAGGGGGAYQGDGGAGGSGGIGGKGAGDGNGATDAPTANTGSGGGGGSIAGSYTAGTAGADGIVIIRYKFQ